MRTSVRVRILGLDPGLTYTGWAVISANRTAGVQWTCEALGRIHTQPKKDLGERLAVLHQKIWEVCTQWAPTVAAIENIFVNSNPASALKLGLARGVVFMTPAHYGIAVKEYSANTVKKSLTGNGHANKEQVLHMVRHLFKITPEHYDSSDALAVAACHYFHVR